MLPSNRHNCHVLQNESLEMNQSLRRGHSKRSEIPYFVYFSETKTGSTNTASKYACDGIVLNSHFLCFYQVKSSDSTPGKSTSAQKTSSKTSKVSNVAADFCTQSG